MLLGLAITFLLLCSSYNKKELVKAQKTEGKAIKKVAQVIGLKPEYIEEYKKLHADLNTGVRDLLKKYLVNTLLFIKLT